MKGPLQDCIMATALADSGEASVPFFAAAPSVVVYQCSEEGPSSERAAAAAGGGGEGDVMSNYAAVSLEGCALLS